MTIEDSDITIAVMGATGSGKSTFINLASGSNFDIGRGLQSCTSSVETTRPFNLDDRIVTVIDTPGFDDTTKSDTDILRMIASFLATQYEHGRKLSGVIYMHRISDFRMSGISTRNFRLFRQICGESTLKNVVIVTNMWSEVNKEIAEAREAELAREDMFFKPALDKGAIMLRHENSKESAHSIIRRIMKNHPVALQIQQELVDQRKDILQTVAGEELNHELRAQLQEQEQEMRTLHEKTQEAIRLKEEEKRRELEKETQTLQEKMNAVQGDAQQVASEWSEQKQRLEQQFQDMAESSRQSLERAREEYDCQMSNVEGMVNQISADFAREREELSRQIQALQSESRGGGGGGCVCM